MGQPFTRVISLSTPARGQSHHINDCLILVHILCVTALSLIPSQSTLHSTFLRSGEEQGGVDQRGKELKRRSMALARPGQTVRISLPRAVDVCFLFLGCQPDVALRTGLRVRGYPQAVAHHRGPSREQCTISSLSEDPQSTAKGAL
jgi:hypothetical protein